MRQKLLQVSFGSSVVIHESTDIAARTTPMKSAPNVFPRSSCGNVEDIVD